MSLPCPWPRLVLALALLTIPVAESDAACDSVDVTVRGIDFGRWNPLEPGPHDGVGEIIVRCSSSEDSFGPATYEITIDGGAAGDPRHRRLEGPRGSIDYGLFLDPARTVPWGGEGGGGAPVQGATEPGAEPGAETRRHIIYGRLYTSPEISPGSYVDQPVITIYF